MVSMLVRVSGLVVPESKEAGINEAVTLVTTLYPVLGFRRRTVADQPEQPVGV